METKYGSAFKRLRTVAKWAITHDKEQLIEAPFKHLQLLSPWEKWGTRAMNASKTCFETAFLIVYTGKWNAENAVNVNSWARGHRLGFPSKTIVFIDDGTGNSRHVSNQCCPWWLNLVGTRSSHNMSRALLSGSLEWALSETCQLLFKVSHCCSPERAHYIIKCA